MPGISVVNFSESNHFLHILPEVRSIYSPPHPYLHQLELHMGTVTVFFELGYCYCCSSYCVTIKRCLRDLRNGTKSSRAFKNV